MSKVQFLNILKNVGLTENESEVYLAGLKCGSATVQRIAENTTLKRPNVYKIIESLISKNLASIEFIGLKKVYKMENPLNLETLLKEKQSKLLEILPELDKIYKNTPTTAEIRISYGLNSLKKVYNSILETYKPGDFYYVISNLDKWKSIDSEFLTEFINKRIKKNIKVKFLCQDGEVARYNKQYEKNFNQEVKILPQNFKYETDTILTPEKMIVVSLIEPITIFEIENSYLINSNKTNFELIWELLK